jgi:hypothetical protein
MRLHYWPKLPMMKMTVMRMMTKEAMVTQVENKPA